MILEIDTGDCAAGGESARRYNLRMGERYLNSIRPLAPCLQGCEHLRHVRDCGLNAVIHAEPQPNNDNRQDKC